MPPRDKFDVMVGAIALALLNSDDQKVLSVVVVALVEVPDARGGGHELRTAVAADSEARGHDIPAILRETAAKIDGQGGLGDGLHVRKGGTRH